MEARAGEKEYKSAVDLMQKNRISKDDVLAAEILFKQAAAKSHPAAMRVLEFKPEVNEQFITNKYKALLAILAIRGPEEVSPQQAVQLAEYFCSSNSPRSLAPRLLIYAVQTNPNTINELSPKFMEKFSQLTDPMVDYVRALKSLDQPLNAFRLLESAVQRGNQFAVSLFVVLRRKLNESIEVKSINPQSGNLLLNFAKTMLTCDVIDVIRKEYGNEKCLQLANEIYSRNIMLPTNGHLALLQGGLIGRQKRGLTDDDETNLKVTFQELSESSDAETLMCYAANLCLGEYIPQDMTHAYSVIEAAGQMKEFSACFMVNYVKLALSGKEIPVVFPTKLKDQEKLIENAKAFLANNVVTKAYSLAFPAATSEKLLQAFDLICQAIKKRDHSAMVIYSLMMLDIKMLLAQLSDKRVRLVILLLKDPSVQAACLQQTNIEISQDAAEECMQLLSGRQITLQVEGATVLATVDHVPAQVHPADAKRTDAEIAYQNAVDILSDENRENEEAKAYEDLRMAADKSLPAAQYFLGLMTLQKDPLGGFYLIKSAADAKHADAEGVLGFMVFHANRYCMRKTEAMSGEFFQLCESTLVERWLEHPHSKGVMTIYNNPNEMRLACERILKLFSNRFDSKITFTLDELSNLIGHHDEAASLVGQVLKEYLEFKEERRPTPKYKSEFFGSLNTKFLAETKSCLAKDPLFPLKFILEGVYSKKPFNPTQEVVVAIKSNLAGLANCERNEEFWRLLNEGVMFGRGKLFIHELRAYGIFDLLFPSLVSDHQANSPHGLDFIEQQVDQYDKSLNRNSRPIYHPENKQVYHGSFLSLLIAKEVAEKDKISATLIENIVSQYKISLTALTPQVAWSGRKPPFVSATAFLHYKVEQERDNRCKYFRSLGIAVNQPESKHASHGLRT